MSNNVEKNLEMSPADYRDLSLQDLQVVADYITKNSNPVGMTIMESQEVLRIYTDAVNLMLYNLNLLRGLAGDPPFPIPTQGDDNEDT
jgi:hypothetical protein